MSVAPIVCSFVLIAGFASASTAQEFALDSAQSGHSDESPFDRPTWILLDTQETPSWFRASLFHESPPHEGSSLNFDTTTFQDIDSLLNREGTFYVELSLGSTWNGPNFDRKCAMGFDRSLLVKIKPHSKLHQINTQALCSALNALRSVSNARPLTFGRGASVTPSDTHFPTQWHHLNTTQSGGIHDADIDSAVAWTSTRGSFNTLVAVLDSGLLPNHPEFVGRVGQGYDFVNEDDNPADDESHGTRVTGLLAARGDNGFGVAGVDWECRILPVKVLDNENRVTLADLAQGLAFAADSGAHIINMSLEGFGQDPLLDSALIYARVAGSILVSCAGNNGQGDADQSYPGASEFTISVGTTKSNDQRWARSGTGARLDFVAPGVDVATVAFNLNDESVIMTGCSASTPIVAGVISLMVGLRPGISQDEVVSILAATAEDEIGPSHLDLPGRDDQYGYGRINAARAVTETLAGAHYYGPDGKGTAGIPLALTVNHRLRPGEPNFKLFVDEALGGTTGFLALGTASASVPLGSEIVFLIGNPLFFLGLPFSGTPGDPGTGFVQLGPVSVPNNPELIGTKLYFQAFGLDPGHPDGISHSAGLELEILP